MRQNRKELDLADADSSDEDLFPSLADITLESVPAVRNLISDLAMDVLLYQSGYREHISDIVSQESNRILNLFKERNPSFSGSVSLCGHSLGSAILFDILCCEPPVRGSEKKAPVDGTNASANRSRNEQLSFDCEELFCLGSPIALFQMLKGKTIAGRSAPEINRSGMPIYSGEETDGNQSLYSSSQPLLMLLQELDLSMPKIQYLLQNAVDYITYFTPQIQ